mmetsp:Transcript_5326/g.16299  ORF Transcript_5326/g.16299 Transcript_5326/m.16299 type:complete len:96 (+) Transcript_5326:610-897(+)
MPPPRALVSYTVSTDGILKRAFGLEIRGVGSVANGLRSNAVSACHTNSLSGRRRVESEVLLSGGAEMVRASRSDGVLNGKENGRAQEEGRFSHGL